MTIQMTSGRKSASGYYNDPVVLYDTVDGMAFGPTFDDRAEAEAFIRWLEKLDDQGKGLDGGTYLASGQWVRGKASIDVLKRRGWYDQKLTADGWRAFLADHKPEQCPYDVDVDSYGVGFTGDSDKSYGDYTMATPDACQCECHWRKVGTTKDGGSVEVSNG